MSNRVMLGNMCSRVIWATRLFYKSDHGMPPPRALMVFLVYRDVMRRQQTTVLGLLFIFVLKSGKCKSTKFLTIL